MRMLVLFHLPAITKADRRAYTVFRRFLLNDGCDMIQFSVYGCDWIQSRNTCADCSTICRPKARCTS